MNKHAKPITTRVSLRALVGGIGLIVAFLCSVVTPAVYATFEYFARADALLFKAHLNAASVAKYVYTHDVNWQYQRVRLAEIIELPPDDHGALRQRLVDSTGKVVLEEGPEFSGGSLHRSAPIIVKAVVIGRAEVEASLFPFYTGVSWVVLFSSALGLAAYLAFRVVPLRVLDRTLGELESQNTRFDTALNNMSQGLSMFDRDQRLVVCNERYARLYGLPPELTRPGTTLQEILSHRVANSLYAVESPEDHALELLTSIGDNLPLIRIVEFTDGRSIVVKRQPMADGGWVATHEDITEQRRIEARVAHMAHHDALTDLANRVLLRERLEETLEHKPRDDKVAVLCMDLDRFKEVNDTLGHPMGDALLQAVALRLRDCVRDCDIVARLGGDEFAILQSAAGQPASVAALARRVIDAVSKPYELDGHQVVLGTSVGIAVAPGDGTEPDQLLKHADLALYRAKGDGRGTFRFFETGMDAAAQTRRKLELDLRTALSTGAFELYYQPLLDLDRNEVTGFEALLRWNHPERGLITPDHFIPLAEETGLIVPIGEWVLRQACAEAANWPEQVKLAVNLSAVQFNISSLVELVFSALSTSRLAASRLELEITESALLDNSESAFATLRRLRDMGVRISLDDFGIGYSCLSYLRRFPFDKIKIDRSFIRDMGSDQQSVAIIQAVIGLGASLDAATVAEGVETRDEFDCLRAFGCTEVQGYFISPPRPAGEVGLLLATIRGKIGLAA
jgi:diguanylate cyclase (GGDEF)-like protein